MPSAVVFVTAAAAAAVAAAAAAAIAAAAVADTASAAAAAAAAGSQSANRLVNDKQVGNQQKQQYFCSSIFLSLSLLLCLSLSPPFSRPTHRHKVTTTAYKPYKLQYSSILATFF